ncbi:hypothetical protein M404DRAFT_1000469, partial [Pisolithus tinctorius Marx 270]
ASKESGDVPADAPEQMKPTKTFTASACAHVRNRLTLCTSTHARRRNHYLHLDRSIELFRL